MKKKVFLAIISLVTLLFIFFAYRIFYIKDKYSVYDSLVYIESINNDTIKSGIGFVYKIDNREAYILTNYHVIDDLLDIYVYNVDKDKVKARVIKYDEYNDIAVISIKNNLNLKEINIGSINNLNVSDKVYIANINEASYGEIIDLKSLYDIFDFSAIKTSIDVTFGDSGSPLLNDKNEVIGMIFLKDENNDKIAFAIPIDFIMNFINSN